MYQIYIDFKNYKEVDKRNNPAATKMVPFLKICVTGINIQNADITKNNNNPTLKKIFKKNSGFPD
ncbi:MAG: hypothetical protein ABF274_09930 [Nonlabens sp.]|uniref:hypothetical protein n=1 Tax=Nonlabens sp. TaxID=1888209 RepID=UPI00321F14F5